MCLASSKNSCSEAGVLREQGAVCVLQRRRGISTGLASSVSSSKQATGRGLCAWHPPRASIAALAPFHGDATAGSQAAAGLQVSYTFKHYLHITG